MRFKITEIINPRGCWRFWKPPNFSLKVRLGTTPIVLVVKRERRAFSVMAWEGEDRGSQVAPTVGRRHQKKEKNTHSVFPPPHLAQFLRK